MVNGWRLLENSAWKSSYGDLLINNIFGSIFFDVLTFESCDQSLHSPNELEP